MPTQFTTPYSFSVGQPVVSSQHNANWQEIETFVNQLQAGTNINNGAIGSAELEDGAVTSSKIAANISLNLPILGTASATSINVSGNVVYHLGTTATITNYTLLNTDDGKIVEISSASAVNLTIPTDASMGANSVFGGTGIPTGGQITIIQTGAGQISVVGASGVTLQCTPQTVANIGKLRTTWSAATLIKRATNTWVLIGDLAA